MQNDMEISIKQLSGNENAAQALSRILIAAWRSGFRGILPDNIIEQYTDFNGCTAMFTQLLSSGTGTMYLAELDGQSVGLLYRVPEQENVRIEALLTVPEVWGRGVAAALMARALADTDPDLTVTVWPFAENYRARRFYEKQGFSPSGRTRMGDTLEMEYVHTAPHPSP